MARNSSAGWRYGIALAAVGAMTLLRFQLHMEPGRFAYVFFMMAVTCSAWYGGLGPGLLAMLLGLAIADHYFTGDTPGFHLTDSANQGRIAVYLCVCLISSVAIASLKRAQVRAEENERQLKRHIAQRLEVERSLRREAEERARVEHQLKETLARAESANLAKSSFLANMSHEIRTPMNAVVGISSILAKGAALPPARQRELIQTLQLSAQSMMSLIDDLLDITRIENDHILLERKPFDLRHLVQEVVEIMSVRAREKNISLTLECDVPHGAFLGAHVRIRQVLLNLLGNAVKFTESGGVILKVYAPADAPGEIAFEILDTGIGIAQEKFDSIFNKFSQADMSIRRKFGGTGLGLAITRRLVELMEGRITLQSKLGQGSLFRVVLPLEAARPDLPEGIVRRDPAPFASIRGEKPVVLLVEDYQPNILIATILLEELGCACEIANNGHEAVAKVEKRPFSLILMDIQMPGMDGYEAVRRIRDYEKAHGRARTPVIGVSAHAFNEDRTRSLSAGMDDYISKPFSHADLKNRILSLLGEEKREAV